MTSLILDSSVAVGQALIQTTELAVTDGCLGDGPSFGPGAKLNLKEVDV